jgi:hypothetical protein
LVNHCHAVAAHFLRGFFESALLLLLLDVFLRFVGFFRNLVECRTNPGY